ncbi:MAG: M42 family peptidase [Oscillospiraceae bacterium]|nr:M42 family peptidase [Oscillospiraceae bacterium]
MSNLIRKVYPNGNEVIFVDNGEVGANVVAFFAHKDEVRFIVNYIDDSGFLRLSTVGGISPSVIYGRILQNDKIRGVVGAKPKHLLETADKEKYPKHIWLDIGAENKDEAAKYAPLGSIFYFDKLFQKVGNKTGGKLLAKAIDDRIGCEIIAELVEKDMPYSFWAVFTNNEEIGCIGGKMALDNISALAEKHGLPNPNIAVVIESTTAADIPDVTGAERVCELGKGAVVSYMDRGTLYDKKLYDQIKNIAHQNNIAVQTKTLIAGGNDASQIHKSRGGIRTAAVSIPTRYLHSPASVADMRDIDSVSALAEKLVSLV